MPKQKITKEMVVDAAFQLAREGGMERVLVKEIADRLGCSVQPIYSCCRNMDGLRRDVYARVRRFVGERLSQDRYGPESFQAAGRACLQLAKEEPQLFKLFILCPREGVSGLDDLCREASDPRLDEAIAGELGLDGERARRLHRNMIVYTVGLGTIFSTAVPGIPAEDIFPWQEGAYQAFLAQIKEEMRNGS